MKQVFLEDFPDNKFDTVPLLSIIKTIEKFIKEIKPDRIYTHHYGDLNIDHRITFDAVITACRPVKKENMRKILAFEVPSSTAWNAPAANNYFMPNVFVDISDTIEKKIEAMRLYKTEIRDYPHPRSIEMIQALAKVRGGAAGMEMAEAFILIRELIYR